MSNLPGQRKPSQKTLDALARGRAARDAKRDARAVTGDTACHRRDLLATGVLKVRELDLSELKRGRVHDGHGSFAGKAPKLPTRIQDAMHAEYIRRINKEVVKHGFKAARLMAAMMDDPEVSDGVRLKAQQMMLERTIGKVPDIIHMAPETDFDRLQQGMIFEFDRSEASVLGNGSDDEEESSA